MEKKYMATIAYILMATISFGQQDSSIIRSKIEAYKESIDNADTVLGYQIWAHLPEVSFTTQRASTWVE